MSFRSLIELDARLSDQFRVAEKPGLLRTIAAIFAHSGDSWFWGAALILLWFISNSQMKKWVVVEFIGISLLIVLVMSIKFLVKRRRPEGEWGKIYRNTDPHSFPSGHAARAFLIAVLATELAPGWLAAVLWIWAPLVAVARVLMGVHYISDIFAGIIVGIVAALIGLQIYPPLIGWIGSWIGFPLW